MGDLDRLMRSVDEARDEIVAMLQGVVRIPTVNTGQMPTGGETAAAEFVAASLAREGIGAEVVESAPGRGNMIARLDGAGGGPSLLFMSHLDVVPVEDPGKWRYPPFSGELAEGKVWGRGSEDCKAMTVAGYFATVLLKRSGLPLKGDSILTATADEESGGFYGYGWLAQNAPEKVRADYAINEGGGGFLPSRDGLLSGLAVGEKGRIEVTMTVSGRSSHAARPWLADNALEKAARVVDAVAAYKPEIDLSQPIFDWLGQMIPGLERPQRANLEDILAQVARVDASTSDLLRALSRMTFTPTVLRSGVKSNSVPASALLKCDIRTLPGQDLDYVRRQVEEAVGGIEGVEVDLEVWARSTQSPFGTPFTSVLERSLGIALGRADVKLAPTLTMGFTDSQYVRPLGVQAYGFSPTATQAERVRPGIHGVDEGIEVESLLTMTRAYLAAAYYTLVELDDSLSP